MIDAGALGATLYLPATREDLTAVLTGGRIAGLRSAVVCLEDSVRADAIEIALAGVAGLLRRLPDVPGGPAVFVRPRSQAMLAHILRMPGADRLAGFALPKVTADDLPGWLAMPYADGHRLMPILETRDALDPHLLGRLRDLLLAVQERVIAIRIGGNDLLQLLGARRSRVRTVYDGPLGPVIAHLVATFAPHGFALAAPVMEGYADPALLAEEVARDVEHGLLTKTAIHPAQLPVIHAGYAVPARDLAEAEAILAADAPAVFAGAGGMLEPATHARWAAATLARARLFGVADHLPAARHA